MIRWEHLSTTPEIPGHSIARNCGVIAAECVMGINVLRDIAGAFRDFVGGRSKTHQNVLNDARKACFIELIKAAQARGGDAVTGIRLDYEEIAGGGKSGMLLLAVSGTAVKLRKPEGGDRVGLPAGTRP